MKYLDVPSSIINMCCEHTAFGDSISIRAANAPSIYNQTDADALARWLRAGYRVTCPNDDEIVQRVLDAYGELEAA